MGTALAFFLFYEGSNLFFAYRMKSRQDSSSADGGNLNPAASIRGGWEQGFRFILLASLYLKGCLLTVKNQVSGSSSQSLKI